MRSRSSSFRQWDKGYRYGPCILCLVMIISKLIICRKVVFCSPDYGLDLAPYSLIFWKKTFVFCLPRPYSSYRCAVSIGSQQERIPLFSTFNASFLVLVAVFYGIYSFGVIFALLELSSSLFGRQKVEGRR